MNRSPSGFHTIVLLLFFFSGATSLVYEVVWLRQLILIFGSTLFATSTILSTFMGGLALGAFIAGRIMDRSTSSPLRIYGLLEIGIGVYALLVPVLFTALTPMYRFVWNAGGSESLLWLSLAKFVGIAAVLLIPTTLMGASLPVLARMVADDPDRIGGNVGSLYATNTFGAVAGTFLAGFVFVPGIGVQKTLWVTAAANFLIGVIAMAYARGRISRAGAASAGDEGPAADPHPRIRLVLVIFAVSGFGAMVLEVAWTRALALVLGSSVYAFSLMLLAFLIGLAAGSAFFAWLLRRRPALRPTVLLAVLLASSGLLAYATAFLFQHLPRLFAEIYFSWSPSPNGWFAVQFCFGLMVMFPATFAYGGLFPAIVQIHARRLEGVSASVGTVYAANTLGTILGAACAGFLFIPVVGVRNSVILIGALQVALALLVCLFLGGIGGRMRKLLAVPLIVVLACMPFVRPGWDVLVMNSGVYMNLVDLANDSEWEDFLAITKKDNVLVYAREGLTASVLVADQPSIGNRYLSVNGKIEASTSSDMETQLMVSHLPLLLHRAPSDVMVIGLASGISVGAVATHPVRAIKVVEVEKAMEPAARLFADHNNHVLDDPRIELSFNDARNELEFSPDTYDVIISEPSNPWMTVASNLFTEDFFQRASTRLREDGLFCQWVQNYCLSSEDMRSIVAAFRSAFPNILLFETFEGVDLLLLGSKDPLVLEMDRIGGRMAELSVWMDLSRVNVRSPVDILPLFRLGTSEVDRLVAGAPRNTDDNARVEFSAPKALYLDTLDSNLRLLERYAGDPIDYLSPAPGPGPGRDRIGLELARAWLRRGEKARAARIATDLLEGPLAAEAEEFLSTIDM